MFVAALSFATAVTIYCRIHKESDRQTVALDSLLPETRSLLLSTDGKDAKNNNFKHIYIPTPMDSLSFPSKNAKFLEALGNQLSLLKKNANNYSFGNLEISSTQLDKVVQVLKTAKSPQDITQSLQAFQICGDDHKGNVRFTGYYSPLIDVRHKSDAVYKYPLYIKSKTKNDNGLLMVYVKDRADIANMRIEGMSHIQFPSGEKELLSFDGEYERVDNTEDPQAIATAFGGEIDTKVPKKILASYSSVFSPKAIQNPFGANNKVPLTSDFTVAVDKKYIPLGSVLLALIPVTDEKGNLIRHEYRYVLAQDTGGAIKGTGHIDLYMGEGEEGKRKAQFFHKYGKIWLLLPKDDKMQGQNL